MVARNIDISSSERDALANRLPIAPIDRWILPFVRFLHVESASGIVLLVCTIVALVLANSTWADAVDNFWQTRLALAVGTFELSKPLLLWVNTEGEGAETCRDHSAVLSGQ